MEILDDKDDSGIIRPIKAEFSPYLQLQLKKIAKTKGITEKEALMEIFSDDVEAMKKAEQRWEAIKRRLKLKDKTAKDQ